MTNQHRLLAALLVALSGSTVMTLMIWPDWQSEGGLIVLAGGGAFVAGMGCAKLFGQPGHAGVGWAVLGALLATSIGAAFAGFVLGLMSWPSLGIALIAPVLVIVTVFTQPTVMLGWVITMTLVHLVSLWLRTPRPLQI
jgi:hypothetical protein